MHETVQLQTRDGTCTAHAFTPSTGAGPWPGAIIYMDGIGIRPSLLAMGQRLADAGYLVLLPDLYYRWGPYEPLDPAAVLAAGARRSLGPMMATTGNGPAAADTAAFLAWFDSRADFAGGRLGATGYCMGGGMALTAAGTFPDRIGAAASFHGGSLATDRPDSPHLLAPQMTARIYVGAAVDDGSYPPEQAERLTAALTAAGVDYTHETYEGALHGWTMPDFPIYQKDAAERHWRVLIDLFDNTLKR